MSFSRKNLTSPSSESLIPSDFSIPMSPFSTAMNTDRKCSKSDRSNSSLSPNSSIVWDSAKWNPDNEYPLDNQNRKNHWKRLWSVSFFQFPDQQSTLQKIWIFWWMCFFHSVFYPFTTFFKAKYRHSIINTERPPLFFTITKTEVVWSA